MRFIAPIVMITLSLSINQIIYIGPREVSVTYTKHQYRIGLGSNGGLEEQRDRLTWLNVISRCIIEENGIDVTVNSDRYNVIDDFLEPERRRWRRVYHQQT